MSVNWNSPVLKSLEPVIRNSKLVRINTEKLVEVANWMAYEEFQKPDGSMLFDFGNNPDVLMDFTMVVNTMNFAFTDFNSGIKFETDYNKNINTPHSIKTLKEFEDKLKELKIC
jgi:hypothetical protein